MNKKIFYLMVVTVVLPLFFVACKPQNESAIAGKWGFVDKDGVTLEITESKIMLLPVVPKPKPMETRSYYWVSENTIEITQKGWGGNYITQNKVIFHTPDSVTIEGWFIGNNEVDVPIYEDVTIERIEK